MYIVSFITGKYSALSDLIESKNWGNLHSNYDKGFDKYHFEASNFKGLIKRTLYSMLNGAALPYAYGVR